MQGNRAVINYEKCHPEQCESGICAAALACARKLLKQEASNEMPVMDPFLCLGCGDCLRACPLEAIRMAVV